MACLVVWDLKSRPHDSGLPAVHASPKGTDEDVHRAIICISRLIAYFDVNRWKIDSVFVWHVAKHSEREIIREFFATLADVKPRLVSWDAFPILEYRAMRRKLAMPHFSAELRDKYAPESIALCDVFSPSQRRISLLEFCTILGLSYVGLSSHEVEQYFQQKRFREDVLKIFQIWLRRELYNGRLLYHEFRESEQT